MPRVFAPGTISAISPSNGKSVDVNALNFLLLGETDFNSKNPDNELGPIAAGGAFGGAGGAAATNASFSAQFAAIADFDTTVFGSGQAAAAGPAAALAAAQAAIPGLQAAEAVANGNLVAAVAAGAGVAAAQAALAAAQAVLQNGMNLVVAQQAAVAAAAAGAPPNLVAIRNAIANGGCTAVIARAFNTAGAVRNYPIYTPAASVEDARAEATIRAMRSGVPAIAGASAAIGRAAADAAELAYAILYKNVTAAGVRNTVTTDEARFEADNEAARVLQKVFDRFTASNLVARQSSNSLPAVGAAVIAARALVPAAAAAAGAPSTPATVGISARNIAAIAAAGPNQGAVDNILRAAALEARIQRDRDLGAAGSGAVGAAPLRLQAFTHHICYFNEFYQNIGRPTTIEELIATLRRNFPAAFNQFLKQGQWKNQSVTASSFILQFEKAIGNKAAGAPAFTRALLDDYAPHFQELKQEFTLYEIQQAPSGFIAPQPQLNSANLHVALLYPGVAQYLKKVRSRLLNNAYAVRSPFFPNMARGGITFQIQTGGNNNQNLNSAYPIEMRGYGHLIASSMKGGSFSGLAIGTVNSPTIWRPLTDDSYIGDSLITATNNVRAKLQSLNITLDPAVEQKIAGRLDALRTAEQAAKNYRDKLNIVARINGNGTGDGQVDWNNVGRNAAGPSGQGQINDDDVDKLVNDYNRSMQQVVKNEGVVLKVLDQLGRVVATHNV